MNKHQKTSIKSWCIVVAIIIVVIILVYPSLSHVTDSQVNHRIKRVVSPYLKAVAQCITKNKGQLENCNAGRDGIPKASRSWFGSIKSIQIYKGVVRLDTRMSLGQKVYVYYIPRLIKRKWTSKHHHQPFYISWHHIESDFCGLDNHRYTCRHFAMY